MNYLIRWRWRNSSNAISATPGRPAAARRAWPSTAGACEAFTGDIPAFSKTETHEEIERAAIAGWLAALPAPFSQRLTALFAEFEAQETQEARLCKALDKMETLIQHNEALLSTWLPLEYQLNFTYGQAQTDGDPYLEGLRAAVNQATREKIDQGT